MFTVNWADLHLLQLFEKRCCRLGHPAHNSVVRTREEIVKISVFLHYATKLPINSRSAEGANLLKLVETDCPNFIIFRGALIQDVQYALQSFVSVIWAKFTGNGNFAGGYAHALQVFTCYF